jgi:hypothetical protein
MIHGPGSGMAKLMHQHLKDRGWAIKLWVDENLKGLVSRGGVCPALTQSTSAIRTQWETTSHTNVRWQWLAHSIKEGAQFRDGG